MSEVTPDNKPGDHLFFDLCVEQAKAFVRTAEATRPTDLTLVDDWVADQMTLPTMLLTIMLAYADRTLTPKQRYDLRVDLFARFSTQLRDEDDLGQVLAASLAASLVDDYLAEIRA